MRFSSALTSSVILLCAYSYSTPAFADSNGHTDCGAVNVGALSLVECANPNDSPGPYAPPPLKLFVVQDNIGVTAELADGTVIDIDPTSAGAFTYTVNGIHRNVADVADTLDAALTVAEQHAISDALHQSSTSDGTDELVDLLAE